MIKQIVENWHEENFTFIDGVAQAELVRKIEAEVGNALDALRADLDDTRESLRHSADCGIAFGIAIDKLTDTITKLGLRDPTTKDTANG